MTGIEKVYRTGAVEFHALCGVDLEIQVGESLAVIGPSGSGKSTLMNIIGCLDPPTAGSYWLDGADVSTLDDDALARLRNRTIGFVFQSFNLLARFSALDNVELPLLYGRMPDSRARAQAALERVGLGPWMTHRPSELSGGQRQRVAIARAIATEPRLLLADEPTGNLDSVTGAEILALFDELHATGVTVVVITHDADVAARTGRILAMRDGRIERDERRAGAGATT